MGLTACTQRLCSAQRALPSTFWSESSLTPTSRQAQRAPLQHVTAAGAQQVAARSLALPFPTAVVQDRVFSTTIANMISYFTRVANAGEVAGMGLCVVIHSTDGKNATTAVPLATIHTGAGGAGRDILSEKLHGGEGWCSSAMHAPCVWGLLPCMHPACGQLALVRGQLARTGVFVS